MAGPGQARFYSSTFVQTSLAAGIGPSTTTFNVGLTTGAPGTPYIVSVDQNTASEELMLVTNVSGLQYTVIRGVGGTSAQTHTNGASVVHVMYAQDLTDASAHIGAFDGVHGLASGSLVVGTSDIQTLSNKTINLSVLNSPTINTPTISGAMSTGAITSNALITAVDFAATGLTPATQPSRYVGGTNGGSPASGSFIQGDFVIDVAGTIWVCTTGGSPGTWMGLVNLSGSQTIIGKTINSSVFNTATIVAATITGAWTGTASINTSNFMKAEYFQNSGKPGATSSSTYAGATVSGAPTGGTFSVGDFVVDQTGVIWVCITAGTPGTWVSAGFSKGVPVAPVTSNSAGTSTVSTTETFDAVLGNYTWNAVSGRRYRAIVEGLCGQGTAAADVYAVRIRDSGSASAPTSASTLVAATQWIPQAAGGPGVAGIAVSNTFTSGSTGQHTIGLSFTRTAGTGTAFPTNAGGISRAIYVEDLGSI